MNGWDWRRENGISEDQEVKRRERDLDGATHDGRGT